MATVTLLSTPTSTSNPTVTPRPTPTPTEVPTLPQATITQLQKAGITVEQQNGQTILTTQNAKGEREVLPGTVEKAEGKWVLATDYKGVDGVAKTVIALEGLQKYHNDELKQDEIAAPMEGVDFARGRFTFIPAYYQAEGVAGHWVEDKVSAVGPLLVNPRYLFDGEIKVESEEAAQTNYRLIQKSLIRMALKWNGNDNPTDDYLEQLVDLAAQNQLPENLKIYPVRSGAEVNESERLKGMSSGIFKLASLGNVDTSKISERILYTEEMRGQYGGITETKNPAISIRGQQYATTVCSFETVRVDGKDILRATFSGYYPYTEDQIKNFSGEYERYILPFNKPDGLNSYRTPFVEVNSANFGVFGLSTFIPENRRDSILTSQGYRYVYSTLNTQNNEEDFPQEPLFSLYCF